MKRTPLRRISKRRKPEYQAYLKERDEFLNGKLCEFPPDNGLPGCYKQATTVHHAKGRYGKLLREQKFWWALCFDHHRYVHAHGRWSRAHGVIIDK